MSINAAQEDPPPLLTPMTSKELRACLGGLINAIDADPRAALSLTVIMAVRLALTAAGGFGDGEEVEDLRSLLEASEVDCVQANTRREAAEQATRQAVADRDRQLQIIEVALNTGSHRQIDHPLAEKVRRVVRSHQTLSTEASQLRDKVAELTSTQEEETESARSITELGAAAARVPELEARIEQLQAAAVRSQERASTIKARALAEQRESLLKDLDRKEAAGILATRRAVVTQLQRFEWAATSRKHQNLPSCVLCGGLEPNSQYKPSDLFGHQRGCMFPTLQSSILSALSN